MCSKYKVLVSSSEFPEAGLALLRDKVTILTPKTNGFDADTLDECKRELMELIEGVDAVVWCCKVPFGKEFLDKAGSQLKVVAAFFAGVDHFDIKEMKARRIPLTNTPYVLDSAVAELGVLLLLGVARRVMENIQQTQSGCWDAGPQKRLGLDVQGSIVGIVGFGRIGQAIVKKLKGFGVKEFMYCGRTKKPEDELLNAKYVTLDELLQRSDYVVVACDLNDSTKNIINADSFKKMKNTAILVNVGRGASVDQDALVEALKNGSIFGAGLDVMTPEPLPKDNPLVSMPNCFLLPHIGSGTITTRNEMAKLAATNALLGLAGEPLKSPVFTL